MSLYQKLLMFAKEDLEDFFDNVPLFKNQFTYSDFNKRCVNKMFYENKQDNIKTVKELKEEIPALKPMCKECAPYFLKPRNQSIKGLDVQMGRFLENILMDFLNEELNIKAIDADKSNKSYPDCMILNSNKGILAYFEVKYHNAPFINAIHITGRYCYEGSITMDFKKLIKQLEIVDSDLERPTFYLHWLDYPCLKGIFFETAHQVKETLYESGEEYDREDRKGDYLLTKKIGYTKKFYSPLLQMGTFEEFISIIKDMKHNGLEKERY